MKHAIRKGVGFGTTSGVITTLGLIVGLHSSTHSETVVIEGILVIAVADALSDSLGIHISEESDSRKSSKSIWVSTFSTFISKLVIALTFLVPALLLPLPSAIMASIVWGFVLITALSYYTAKQKNVRPYKVILEHLLIAGAVIIMTHYLGDIASAF